MGWLSRLFGRGEDGPRKVPIEAQAPTQAPVTPMAVLNGSDSSTPDSKRASHAFDLGDEEADGVTLIPGDGSDMADAMEAMRKQARDEMRKER